MRWQVGDFELVVSEALLSELQRALTYRSSSLRSNLLRTSASSAPCVARPRRNAADLAGLHGPCTGGRLPGHPHVAQSIAPLETRHSQVISRELVSGRRCGGGGWVRTSDSTIMSRVVVCDSTTRIHPQHMTSFSSPGQTFRRPAPARSDRSATARRGSGSRLALATPCVLTLPPASRARMR